LPTLILLGIMVSESRGSGGAVVVTVTVAVAVSTVLSAGFVNSAVMAVVPGLTPWATPLPVASPEVIEATVGMLETHLISGEFVTSS
jgi:hypothetical protein